MAKNPITWFEIYVDDMNRAKTFYETVLEIELTHLPMPEDAGGGEMWTFPWVNEAPNCSGALVKHEMGKPSATGTLIYFDCKDCAVELARVAAAGGKVNAPKFSIGDFGFIALASDTEGNSIGFHSMK
jgi:uncharacterized protein